MNLQNSLVERFKSASQDNFKEKIESISYGARMYWLGRVDKIHESDYKFYINLTNEHSGFKSKIDISDINHHSQKFAPEKENISYYEAENNIKNFLDSWVKENLEIKKPKKKKKFGFF
tara:strand:+ start:220 stop:573 length:354 start_codon:yes stop_codon:yes gene_type:complete